MATNEPTRWTRETMIPRVRKILLRRWPEAVGLLDEMLDKGKGDRAYGSKLDELFSESGSTLMLRELTEPFGEYLAAGEDGRAFRNAVNAIDSARGRVVWGKELFLEQVIVLECLEVMRKHLDKRPLSLLESMFAKASEDLAYDLKLEAYFFQDRGDIEKLRSLAFEVSDEFRKAKDKKSFENNLVAINSALLDVWSGAITLDEECKTEDDSTNAASPSP